MIQNSSLAQAAPRGFPCGLVEFLMEQPKYKPGDILVFNPNFKDTEFSGSVVLILASGSSTVGVNIASGQITGGLFKGGPLPAPDVVMVHPSEFNVPTSIPVGQSGYAMTPMSDYERTAELILKKPHPSIVLAGYAGWSPGQLESEVENGLWRKSNISLDQLMRTYPGNRWQLAASSIDNPAPAPKQVPAPKRRPGNPGL